METIKITIQLNESFNFLLHFCYTQICNDDCCVIYKLLSNVKSLFDHVTRRYDIASLGAKSERQDRQAD